MSETMQLDDGTSSVGISPLVDPEYEQPDRRDRQFFEADDGTRWWSDWGSKEKHDLSLNDLSKAEADLLNVWWEGLTMLTFIPDLQGAPGTSIYVRIRNDTAPFQMWFPTGWQTKYEGRLILREVSSSSSG